MNRFLWILAAISVCAAQDSATQVRMLRSFSGPSGKVVGSKFVFDETRNRFLYPQDRSLVVYFEWDAPPGEHTVTATWKNPDGRVAYISPDLRIQAETTNFSGYWTYDIYPTTQSGVWTLEVRVDGQPAGSHSFEVVGPVQTPTMTIEQLYQLATPSLVWIHKLDAAGSRFDTSSGFVLGKDRIATAFQAIDGADLLEIEFEDRRTFRTDRVWLLNRQQDWAVIDADTRDLPPLETEVSDSSYIGESLILFSVVVNRRTIGAVDISGRSNDPILGERLQFSPTLQVESHGGPLLTQTGKVVGIVGGSMAPGARVEERALSRFAARIDMGLTITAATPIAPVLVAAPSAPVSLQQLRETGVLTPRLAPTMNLRQAGVALSVPKDSYSYPPSQYQFSRREKVWVFSDWQKHEKNSKGTITARLFDVQGRVVVDVKPKRVNLTEKQIRVTFSTDAAVLPAGTYRVDVIWNGQPAWRTFIGIVE